MNFRIKSDLNIVDQTPDKESLELLNHQLERKSLDEFIEWSFNQFGSKIVLGTAFGLSGMILIHKIATLKIPMKVFTLDTGLLFDETYDLWEKLKSDYEIVIETVSPILTLDGQAHQYKPKLWEKDPDKCCYLRKVLPLKKYLMNKEAWITGLRRSQSDTRKHISMAEWDNENKVLKFNPLADWSNEQVWDYIHEYSLVYNPLHDDGYPSIGCFPCTTKAASENDERSGRWGNLNKTECGIHFPISRENDNP